MLHVKETINPLGRRRRGKRHLKAEAQISVNHAILFRADSIKDRIAKRYLEHRPRPRATSNSVLYKGTRQTATKKKSGTMTPHTLRPHTDTRSCYQHFARIPTLRQTISIPPQITFSPADHGLYQRRHDKDLSRRPLRERSKVPRQNGQAKPKPSSRYLCTNR